MVLDEKALYPNSTYRSQLRLSQLHRSQLRLSLRDIHSTELLYEMKAM